MPPILVPIVEGHGEVQAVPVLLRRIVDAQGSEDYVEVAKPIRAPRSKLLKDDELVRLVELAVRRGGTDAAVLVLLDADDDCAAELGPRLLAVAGGVRPEVPVAVVLAVREFEGWFLAAAPSIAGRRGLPAALVPPDDSEAIRDAKGWLQERREDGLAYSPTVDQPALAAVFDLALARGSSASFNKLWREVARLVELGS